MNTNVYEVIQIDKNSWRIENNGVRSFLFTGTKTALLIDSGYDIEDMNAIVRSLTLLPVKLVNTHTDVDHIGCNIQFDKTYMHPAEYARFQINGKMPMAVEPLWEGDNLDIGERRFEVILIPGHTPGSIALLDAENRVLISGDSV